MRLVWLLNRFTEMFLWKSSIRWFVDTLRGETTLRKSEEVQTRAINEYTITESILSIHQTTKNKTNLTPALF